MNDRIRLGFVGLGIMGKDLLKEVLRNPKASVTALCDLDPAALDAAAPLVPEAPQRFTDRASLLREGKIDAVVVAAPQFAHAEIAIAALDAGFPVFCEKPMALDVAGCRRMIDAGKRAGKPLMIGQVLRYIGPYRYILERVRSGDLGRPVAMRTIRTAGKWKEPWLRQWRLEFARCGGMLPEVNVHEIDLMLCLLGRATSVSAAGANLANKQVDYEDFITGHLTFENGGFGSVTSVVCDHLGKSSGEVFCERGTIYFDSVTSELRIAREDAPTETLPYAEIHPEWENGVYREMREFVETCLGEHEVTIPGEEGIRGVEIAQAMYLSARNASRPISLPLP